MKYSNFNIKNFKGISDLLIDLSIGTGSKVFTLIGLNESGKTTILEAIDWLYHPDAYDPHDLIPKSELANFNGVICVSCLVTLTDEDEVNIKNFLIQEKKFVLLEKINKIIISREFKYFDSTLNEKNYKWELTLTGKSKKANKVTTIYDNNPIFQEVISYCYKKLLPPIFYYPNFLFDFPDNIYLEYDDPSKQDKKNIQYKDVIQDVLNSMEKNLTIEKHIVQRYKSNKKSDTQAMENVLNKLESKIGSEVFTAWKDLLKISGEGLSIALGKTPDEDELGLYLQLKIKEGDQCGGPKKLDRKIGIIRGYLPLVKLITI